MKSWIVYVLALLAAVVMLPVLSPAVDNDRRGEGVFYADKTAQSSGNTGIYVRKTCSGEEAVPRPERYIFGLHDEQGACSTRLFIANSYDEAYGCAVKLCPNCRIEDITGTYMFGSSVPGVVNLKNYCPKRN